MRSPTALASFTSLFLTLVLAPLALPACSASPAATVADGPDAGGTDSGPAATDGSKAVASRTSPAPQILPKVTGTCPTFAAGKASFAPEGKARDVQLWVTDAAKTLDGPVVFFWHGAGGRPTEAHPALSPAVVAAITAAGGIVAAPYHDPASGQLPWFLALGGSQEDDLKVMDEVVACAIANIGIDKRHIHSVGFSAGAMNTMQIGWRRSGYVASVVAYSGGVIGEPPVQDEGNLFPAMIMHGGDTDKVIISFKDTSVAYKEKLTEAGHFSFICAHGNGHTVPSDARASAWKFLEDHPFGTNPSPYVKALPDGFPSYCAL